MRNCLERERVHGEVILAGKRQSNNLGNDMTRKIERETEKNNNKSKRGVCV